MHLSANNGEHGQHDSKVREFGGASITSTTGTNQQWVQAVWPSIRVTDRWVARLLDDLAKADIYADTARSAAWANRRSKIALTEPLSPNI
jgi:hypothetical protein